MKVDWINMEIQATFKGMDGNLGFRNGEKYLLKVKGDVIYRLPDGQPCPYGSIEMFLRNWDNIKT